MWKIKAKMYLRFLLKRSQPLNIIFAFTTSNHSSNAFKSQDNSFGLAFGVIKPKLFWLFKTEASSFTLAQLLQTLLMWVQVCVSVIVFNQLVRPSLLLMDFSLWPFLLLSSWVNCLVWRVFVFYSHI